MSEGSDVSASAISSPTAGPNAIPTATARFRMAFGPATELEIANALTSEPSLKTYHLLPSVRGDLLFKLGRFGEAHAEFERAASLTRNARERALLLERAAACARRSTSNDRKQS